jgi:hypothetical protein
MNYFILKNKFYELLLEGNALCAQNEGMLLLMARTWLC